MIRVENLCAGYGGAEVLHGVGFNARDGEFIGILGPNACGKSTLVKALTGLLSPSAGRVEIAGLDPAKAKPLDVARVAAVVPQTTRIPFPYTGHEVVAMGRFPHAGRFGPLSENDRAAITRAMELTDTLGLKNRSILEVSGGERQRLVLARAMAQEAPLLVLDEATASMDAHRAMDAFDLLNDLNRAGRTIVAVLHDLNLAALYCRRLLIMKEGRVVADGPTNDVFTAETLRGVYETPVEVFTHSLTGRPHALFLPRSKRFFDET